MMDIEPSDYYVVETTATLSGNGGYGLLIETESEDERHDHGYAVQFDKSYAKSIVIRERIDGSESSPIMVTKLSDYITGADSSEWWNEEHTLAVEVESVSEKESALRILVDGVLVGSNDNIILIDANDGANKVGVRSWTSETEYNYLDYTKLD